MSPGAGAGGPRGARVPGNRWDLAPRPQRPPTVTVVVTHYEQPAQLRRTLAALAAQTVPARLIQVVVADDGSAESPRVPDDVLVVTQPDDGFRAARIRNLAAQHARGEVLLFLDADTTPEPDYVAALARLPGVVPEAVVVGRRRHADLTGHVPGEDLADHGRRHELAAPTWLTLAYERTNNLLDADETSFRYVVGAVMGCSRWFFETTGGFDESFVTYGGEDWEWASRAWTHGAVLAHVPAAVAWHDGPSREERPGWSGDASGRARLLRETLAIASRVPIPGTAPRALLGTAGDPVVTVAAGITGDALVLCLDSLLEAWPRARVLVDAERRAMLPADPRVVEHRGPGVLDAPQARSAWRHLHLVSPTTGDRDAWTAAAESLAGARGHGRVDVVGPSGEVVARWSTLRLLRLEERWGDHAVGEATTVRAQLVRPGDTVTAQSRWGGWG